MTRVLGLASALPRHSSALAIRRLSVPYLARRWLSSSGKVIYTSPTEKPVRLLKIFCVSGTAVTFAAAPLLMLIDSTLPMVARIAAIGFATFGTGSTTAFVARYFSGYVSSIKRNPDTRELVFSTSTLLLRPRLTTVYDDSFLVPSERPGAKLALADHVNGNGAEGTEETIAQTTDDKGRVLGRWIVRWEKGGVGRCQPAGNVVRDFQLHEELLSEPITRSKS